MKMMKLTHTHLMAGLAICVVAIILVIYKIEDDRKNRDASSAIVHDEGSSSAARSQGTDKGLPRSARRKRAARENLGVLQRLGYVLTADDIGDHTAEGNVQVKTPKGDIFRSERMSISSDGDNIFLYGSIKLERSTSGFVWGYMGADAFGRIAVDGSSQSFKGKPLSMYEPGSTFIPSTAFKGKAVIASPPNKNK
jgi:hypothetical protein